MTPRSNNRQRLRQGRPRVVERRLLQENHPPVPGETRKEKGLRKLHRAGPQLSLLSLRQTPSATRAWKRYGNVRNG